MNRKGIDKCIVEEFRGGSQEAFVEIFHFYKNQVLRLGRHLFKAEDVSEDFAQEVWAAVWQNRARFKHVDNFDSYFWTLAYNRANDRRRTSIMHYNHVQRYLNEKDVPVHNDVEHVFSEADTRRLLDHALETTTPSQQKVFKMSRLEGLSSEEIAARMNISKQTVDNHITSALKQVRIYWETHLTHLIFVGLSSLMF